MQHLINLRGKASDRKVKQTGRAELHDLWVYIARNFSKWIIVPADDMGVVRHTEKKQTPMSFAK